MERSHACVLFIALVFLVSCSGDREPQDGRRTRGDYVWRQQVEAIDKAREVEDAVIKAAEKNKDNIKQQTQ